MRIYRHTDDVPSVAARAVVCGSFDGLHLGHRALLRRAVESFSQTAVVVDERSVALPRLASRRRVVTACNEAGAEEVLLLNGARQLDDVLHRLEPRAVVAGAGEAIPDALRGTPGFVEVEPVLLDGQVVCSSLLRKSVEAGDLDTAGAMLSHPYSVDGRVVHGFHRGASIGVPTANLRVRDLQLPPDGVYAVSVNRGLPSGLPGWGVANLGRNPTFGNEERSLETNIFDFDGDLYGAYLEVGFVRRLRGEKKFQGLDELVAQIHRDIEVAREIRRDYE